jgi:hypothetical protein
MSEMYFWERALFKANCFMSEGSQLSMRIPEGEELSEPLPDNIEAKIFECKYKDGNMYGKGVMMEKKQMQEASPDVFAKQLADSFLYVFEQIKKEKI